MQIKLIFKSLVMTVFLTVAMLCYGLQVKADGTSVSITLLSRTDSALKFRLSPYLARTHDLFKRIQDNPALAEDSDLAQSLNEHPEAWEEAFQQIGFLQSSLQSSATVEAQNAIFLLPRFDHDNVMHVPAIFWRLRDEDIRVAIVSGMVSIYASRILKDNSSDTLQRHIDTKNLILKLARETH